MFGAMKNVIRSTVLSLLFIAASMAYGGVPAMKVTVSDAAGNASFKGAINANGVFATAHLKPGNYVVQFNANSAAVKGSYYALVISAGKKKVVADSVPGEKFAGGGVAMRVAVGAGLNITGQVANVKVTNGKILVWIPPMLGSNMPGHWAEKGSAEEISSRTRGIVPRENLQKIHETAQSF
jgi:hypothetical protein